MSHLLVAPKIVNNYHIKVFAASLMVIDHIGMALSLDPLRIIGRLSFPAFSWLIYKGVENTKDFRRYQWRMLLLALASQPILMAFKYHFGCPDLFALNPVFTLWLSLHAIKALQGGKFVRLSLTAIASNLCSYGIYGIIIALLFSIYPSDRHEGKNQIQITKTYWMVLWGTIHFIYAVNNPVQLYAIVFGAIVPWLNSITERGPHARWFYFFYPIHFLVLFTIFFRLKLG